MSRTVRYYEYVCALQRCVRALACFLLSIAMSTATLSCGKGPDANRSAAANGKGDNFVTGEQEVRPVDELVREAILLHAAADWTDVHTSGDRDAEWAENLLTSFGYLVRRPTKDLAIIFQHSDHRTPAEGEVIRWFQDESAAVAWFAEDPQVRRQIPVVYLFVHGDSAANAHVKIMSGLLSVDQQGDVAIRRVGPMFGFKLTFGGTERKRPLLVLESMYSD